MLGVGREQTREVLHESQQMPRLLDALGEPFGGASLALLFLLDQRAKARTPLVGPSTTPARRVAASH